MDIVGLSRKTGYILGISRGHNAGVCLLKDGDIVFSIEEERLSRRKYDGGPLAGIIKVLDYTDKVDYIAISHTQQLRNSGEPAGRIEYTGDDIYTAMARKLGLIDRTADLFNHPQIIDLSYEHHKIHAALAFYSSGFESAAAIIIDGAGSCHYQNNVLLWEIESIFNCSYNSGINTVYKHLGCKDPIQMMYLKNRNFNFLTENTSNANVLISDRAGIVKAYEAITAYCGFNSIEAGKTMGLFPYGNKNDNLPELINDKGLFPLVDRNVILPSYPGSAFFNNYLYKDFCDDPSNTEEDLTILKDRRDAAYWVQINSQKAALDYIIKAAELTDNKNVVLCGGYGLNCVANYYYLEELNNRGINFYVEPISNDGGTAIGAALLWYYHTTKDTKVRPVKESIYLGPKYAYSIEEVNNIANKYSATVSNTTDNEIVDLLCSRNIVALFQGRSENGPRALGNRSILFDPRVKDGKDFVNTVKRREYFRPFAGSILEEDVHTWFDLRGMNSSPHMMYAVNCRADVEKIIPSIIHVDGTCRIQTVTKEQNELYYNLINTFKEKTGVPILFNTSFNLGGEPLVETLDDAIKTLFNSDIEYLYLPEYKILISIKNDVKRIN